nr:hypothetical protein Hi04_10k_c4246_00020 [uncultured bacterium]
MTPPEKLLAAILRTEAPVWPSDWTRDDEDALVQTAALQGVAPLVAFLLDARRGPALAAGTVRAGEASTEPGWPAHVLGALHQQAAGAAAHHALRMRELGLILEALAAQNVRPVLTKGVVLAHTLYPQPPLRPSFDVDLFVAVDDIGAVARVFEDRGYRRSRQVSGPMVMPQFDYERKCEHGAWHIFDVHFRPVNPQVFAETLTFEEVAAEAVDIEALGPLARGTSARHALLLACLHRVAHHPSEDRLIWLYDVHLLAESLSEGELWHLAAVADGKKVCGVLGAGLAAARAVFHTKLPVGLLEELERRSLAASEHSRTFIDGPNKIDVLLSDLRVVPRWRDRVRLLGQHVFPSSTYMLRLYDAHSRALLPALYTHRLFTGAWRWLRS